jgi:hypothetical protein
MTMGTIQPLTEMGTRNISWEVKAVDVFWKPHLLETSGCDQACTRIIYYCFLLLIPDD